MRLSSSLLFGATLLITLATLGQAVAINQTLLTNYTLGTNQTFFANQTFGTNQTLGNMASGYKNVAYFVNWVSSLKLAAPPPLYRKSKTDITTGHLRAQLQSSRSARRRTYSCALRFRQCSTRNRRGLSDRHLV